MSILEILVIALLVILSPIVLIAGVFSLAIVIGVLKGFVKLTKNINKDNKIK